MNRFWRSARAMLGLLLALQFGVTQAYEAQAPAESRSVGSSEIRNERQPIHPPPGTSTIEGTVTDAKTGRGIANLAVTLRTAQRQVCGEAVTDGAGRYAFRNIAEGTYSVEVTTFPVQLVGTEDRRKEGRVSAGATLRLDWAIPPSVTLRSRVVTAEGLPAAGFPVTYGVGNGDVGKVTTDRDGRFSVTGIPPKSKMLFGVLHAGQMQARGQEWIVGDEPVDEYVVKLCRAATISGTVIDADGEPMAHAEIAWHSLTRFANASGGGGTDAKGAFVLSNLYAGPYELTVKPPEGVPGRAQRMFTVEVAEGENVSNVVMTYNPAIDNAITWRITDAEGSPLAGAMIGIATKDQKFFEFVKSDADGNFSLHDLDAAEYYIASVGYRSNEYMYSDLEGGSKASPGQSGVEVRLKLKAPRDVMRHLKARVISAESRAPIPSLRYQCQQVQGVYTTEELTPYRFVSGREFRESHDSEGRVDIPVYANGRHALIVSAPGYASWLDFVDAPTEDLVIRLEPESRIAGRLIDSAGSPIAGARVFYDRIIDYSPPKENEIGALGNTDSNGQFETGGLPSKLIGLTFLHPDFEVTRVEVAPQRGENRVPDVTMRRAGIIEGTFYLDGKPIGAADLQLVHPSTLEQNGAREPVKPDGTYRQTRLSIGEYKVHASIFPSEYEGRRQTQQLVVQIAEGAVIRQDFHFSSK